ncbi:MAG: biotin--[acetyl-CoA-carboxylase] ligase [Gammaproteobacteria bacterium]|nr:biotin--[acetyl-CoA-carboxylase] ligase [Gammaproteobacteria bacterium]
MATDRRAAIAIREALSVNIAARLSSLDVYDEIDSTNSALLRLSPAQPGRFRACLADYQYSGRGRREREWVAGPGDCLCLSVSATTDATAVRPALSLCVGVQVVRQLEALGIDDVGLKWPNDIVHGGGKLGGILIELHQRGAQAHLVVGIGLNLGVRDVQRQQVSADGGLTPVGLQEITGDETPGREQLAAAMITAIIESAGLLEHGDDRGWRADWERFDVLRGREVDVVDSNGRFRGIVETIDEEGALLVSDGEYKHRLVAADVSVRPS